MGPMDRLEFTAEGFVWAPYADLSVEILSDWMDKDVDVVGESTVERLVRLPGTIETQDRQQICEIML